MSQVTLLLDASRRGDARAVEQLFDLLYDDLRQLAHARLRRSGQFTLLDTTALVHESYLKMVDQNRVDWQSRAHFLGVAARAMRQVVIDHARRRGAAKRGGNAIQTTIEEGHIAIDDQADFLLSLDQALGRLESHNPRLARIVECRFFAGLSEEETAAALGVSLRTAQRDWMKARAWLQEELRA